MHLHKHVANRTHDKDESLISCFAQGHQGVTRKICSLPSRVIETSNMGINSLLEGQRRLAIRVSKNKAQGLKKSEIVF